MRKLHNILITGGAGFIGSNFIHYLFGMSSAEGNLFNDANFDGTVVNVDCLTYAGNLESLKDVEEKFGGKRYFFEKVDICDRGNLPLKQKIPIYKESEFKFPGEYTKNDEIDINPELVYELLEITVNAIRKFNKLFNQYYHD